MTVFDPAGFFASWSKTQAYLFTGLLMMVLPVEPTFLRDQIQRSTSS